MSAPAGPVGAVVLLSGGIGSWAAAKRAVARFGPHAVVFLFTDTTDEDADLYRFLVEGAANAVGLTLTGRPNVPVPAPEDREGSEEYRLRWKTMAAQVPNLVWLEDGRGLWPLFGDRGMIASGQRDTCSEDLKRKLTMRYLRHHGRPAEQVLVLGIGWEESHRLQNAKGGGIVPRYAKRGWRVWAPLTDKPWQRPQDLAAWCRMEGLTVPRLYAEGFAHNNCGGFCVKAGDGAVIHLLKARPALYAYHEAEEAAFNAARPDKPEQTVFTPYVDGGRRPMSLRAIRERHEAGGQFDLFDLGGCGCFTDERGAA